MSHVYLRPVIFSLALLGTIACSKVNPNITASEDLPPIQFNESIKASKTSFVGAQITLSGQVSKFARTLEYSLDDGNTWIPLTAPLLNKYKVTECAEMTCPFDLILNDAGSNWSSVGALTPNSSANISFRGTGEFGFTGLGSITFKRLSSSFSIVGGLVTPLKKGSGIKATPSGFKVEGARLSSRPSKALGSFGASATSALSNIR